MNAINPNITGKKTDDEPEWESPGRSAKMGGVSRSSIYNAIARGELDVRKDGRRTLVNVASRKARFNNLPKAQIALPRKAVTASRSAEERPPQIVRRSPPWRTSMDQITNSPSDHKSEAIRAELVGSNTAIAAGLTVVAYAPVLELCRQLVAAGHDPRAPLLAYRGGVLALKVRSIGARLTVEDNKSGTPTLRRCRNRALRDGTAPPIAPIRGAGRS